MSGEARSATRSSGLRLQALSFEAQLAYCQGKVELAKDCDCQACRDTVTMYLSLAESIKAARYLSLAESIKAARDHNLNCRREP